MIKIRLTRGGVKNKPIYRIVAIESTKKRDGEPLEILGYWNPEKDELKVDKKKMDQWVKNGAQVSDRVRKLTNS